MEVKADFRSVCRLFRNQTVTDRSFLHDGFKRSRTATRNQRNPRYTDLEFWAAKKPTNHIRSREFPVVLR